MTETLRVLGKPVDIAWLAAFRVLFGLTMCISMLRFIAFGWIDSFFVSPAFHFKYWGFHWVKVLPSPAMHGLFWLLALLALWIAVGFLFRLAATGFVIGFAYLHVVDVTTYLNHYYLATLLGLLLALSPAHRAWSIDAALGSRRTHRVAAFWLYLFRFQMGTVYTFAGLAKLDRDWLIHGQPLRIWLSSHTDLPWLGSLFRYDQVPLVMSWSGFVFDATIAWFLLWSRARPWAFATLIVFHAFTSALFPIGMFPVIMVLGAMVYFPPDWPCALWNRFFERQLPCIQHTLLPRHTMRVNKLALLAACLFCTLQIALPLRFVVYGGNVRWHEQGMRWSWRVMTREKNGSVTFVVRDAGGRRWEVSPHQYLTRVQEREMAGQPDLILQLAHHIRDDFARKGHGKVEVRVDAFASLNGRRMARLIDPAVNLAETEDGHALADWILPAPAGPPPHLRAI